MKGEFKKTLTVTKYEQKIISTFMDTMEEIFKLDFEETPEDLVEIMYTISMQNPKAYLSLDKGTMEIKYQDDYEREVYKNEKIFCFIYVCIFR